MSQYKILVTGGAGYVGSTLAGELLAAGHQVTVVDNFMFHQNSLGHLCRYPGFQIVRGDVRSEKIMLPLLKEADVIIPLAALVGAPLCNRDPLAATSTNRDAIVWMAKHLSKQQRVLMPNTNSGYGIGEKAAYCTEDSPLNPISLYGIDKVAAEKAVLEFGNAISFRLVTVFGMSPRMRIDLLVNDFTYRAVTDRFIVLFEGHFRRNFVHVRDVAGAFLHGIEHFEKMKGQAYNVGLSEANVSKRELCERIKKHVPEFVIMEAPVGEDPDKRDYVVSNEKIEKTGFFAKVSLDDGIRELLKGYRMIRNTIYGNV